MGLAAGPLVVPWWELRDIASRANGNENVPPDMDLRDDLVVLGLDGLWTMSEAPENDQRWTDWVERARTAIATSDIAWTRRVEDTLIARPGHRGGDWDRLLVDPATLGIMDHYGVNPVMLAMISRLQDDMALENLYGDNIGINVADIMHQGAVTPFLRLAIELGDSSWECGYIELHDADLPETLALAIQGMPLRDVVSHPALDPHAITVVELAGPNIMLRHDGPCRRVLDWTPHWRDA